MRWFGLSFLALVVTIVLLVPVESEVSGDTSYSAYDSLSDQQKDVYDSLLQTVSNMEPKCDASDLTVKEGEAVRQAFLSDHPEFFWFNNEYSLFVYASTGMSASFDHTGEMTLAEARAMSEELDAAVKSITITGSTEADRIRSIHDAVAFGTSYDKTTEQSNNIYGTFVEGKSKCDGYSYAFNYLCKLNGISSLCIVGTADSEKDGGHAWNLVRTNGSWYYVDVTWDDVPCPDFAEYDYFLVGSETETPTGKFSVTRTADSEYGVTSSSTAFAYDPYSGDSVAHATWLEYSSIYNAGNTVSRYYISIGDFKLTYDYSAMKTLAKYMSDGSYENWAVKVERVPAGVLYGLIDPFKCIVSMYLDEKEVTLKELGLDSKLSLEAPADTEHPDYLTDAYYQGERISHGTPFILKETGTYIVGYIEKTFMEKWGIVLGGIVLIAAFIAFRVMYNRKYPPNYVPDLDEEGAIRRFDRDCICPECGHTLEQDAEFCPYCGRKC